MPDYTKGQIYIIRNHDDNRVYIGSTTQTLAQRMSAHRAFAKFRPQYKLYHAFEELGVDRFYIERLEEFPCSDKQALHSREGHFVRLHDSANSGLNGQIPGRTRAEYQKDRYQNDDSYRKQLLEYQKDRYQNNDSLRKQQSERLRDWWVNLTEEQRETRRQLRRERYRNDPEYRERLQLSNFKCKQSLKSRESPPDSA